MRQDQSRSPVRSTLFPETVRRAAQAYFIAACLALSGAALRAALSPVLLGNLPYLTFFPAVLLSGMHFGVGPGLFCLLLSACCAILLLPSQSAVSTNNYEDLIGAFLFLIMGAIVVFLADGQRRAQAQALAHAEAAERSKALLHEQNAYIETLNLRLREAMRETHHRVKNNLQVIGAMLDMQRMDHAGALHTPEAERLAAQIRTLASLHDLLDADIEEGGLAIQVSASALLHRLLLLLDKASDAHRITANLEEVVLPTRQATALALTVQELVMNGIKYGRSEVTILLCYVEGELRLEVCDDGPGFPADFDSQARANTGLALVESFVRRDLGGQIHFANREEGGGCVRIIAFPYDQQSRK